jgi:hypothetical protein
MMKIKNIRKKNANKVNFEVEIYLNLYLNPDHFVFVFI